MSILAIKKTLKSRLYQIRMTEEMYQKLMEISKKTKIQRPELIRQLLEYGLSQLEKEKV